MVIADLGTLVHVIVSGVAVGSTYALVALGFVLIYKASDVLNFAQGELMMVGGYLCFAYVAQLKLPFLPAFLLTLVTAALVGMLIELLFLRRLIGESVFTVMMVTVGLGGILKSLVGLIWGEDDLALPSPFAYKTLAWSFAGGELYVAYSELFNILTSAVLFGLFMLFFKFARTGIAMRATAEDQDTAFLMGISVKRVFALSWAIASVVAAASGIFYAEESYLHAQMGFIGLRAMPAAILGGIDSIAGAILGGLTIGMVESFAGAYLGTGVRDIVAFVILILVLMVRPYGFFGTQQLRRV
ncbi:MAG: branched-chain amino acid ABC transporter permease [Candidatus Tectomicrobia bacterium]|nr:branched-chain amino acid ABC transporter permease [Candidatus Tectomicrobia bacterium]